MVNILNIKELGKLEILEIYDFYDQPILYSCRNASGHLYLVIAAAEDNKAFTWLCVAVSVERLNLIRSGAIDLHDAFAHPEDPYVIQVKVPYKPQTSIQTDFIKPNQISGDMLPLSGECLDLEIDKFPVLSNSEELLRSRIPGILDISLLGDKTQAEIANLGKIFEYLQSVINAIGYVKFQSKDNMGLSLFEIGTGSFKIRIVPTSDLGLFGYTDCGDAIEEFLKLVNAGNNQTELKECLGRLKSNVAKKYTKLLNSLNQSGSDTVFTWTSPRPDQVGTAYISNSQMQEAIEILQKFQEETPLKHVITGTLIGGSLRTRKLEIKTPGRHYKGIIVDKNFKYTVDVTLGKEYSAEIQEVPERSETTGEITKKEYRLLSLREIK